jgi:PAS domain S-box-containing protein
VQSYRSIDSELTEAVLSKNAALAELATVTLSEKLDRLVDIGVSLAARVRFRQLISEGKWVEASHILAGVRTDFPFVDRIGLNDFEGTVRAVVPHVPEVIGRNFADRDWYKGVSREWKPYVSNVYRRASAPLLNVFAVVVPIRSEEGKVLGALLLQIRLDTLFEWTRDVDIGHEGYLYIVDQTGRVAYHPRLPLQGDFVELSAVPAVRLALEGRKGVEVAAAPGASEESVRAYEPVRKYGWAVVAEQPAVAAFETKNLLLRRLLLAYSLTGLFCVAAVYLVSRIVIQYRRTKELQESEQRYRYLFESNPVPMWIVDASTQEFLVVNDEAVEALGYTRAEFLAMTSFDLRAPEDRAMHEKAVRNLDPLVRVRRQAKLLRKDGVAREMEITAHPFVFEGRQARLVLVNDITDRLRAEDEIRKLNTELERRVMERTSQLEASNKELESFSYSVSHDLRSPLRAIDGFCRILTEDCGDKLDDEGRRLLGVVRDNSRKMGQLIDDLLEFSRLGRKPLSAAVIHTQRLVEEVLGELQAGNERRPQFTLGALPPAYGDAVLIKQAWVNLLDNAIKFSGKHGQPVIEVSGHENGAENVYCVKDNGAGFDMRYYDKLFGVFQRLHRTEEFEGTGVGLAIVQRVVARHGGRVWAEGEVDRGAVFYFSLPKGRQDGQI